MTLTFVTNFVHHHQLPVADEFYRLLGDNYHYVATDSLPDWLIKGGYDPTLDRSYIIRSYQSEADMMNGRRFIDESDVVIMGDAPLEWAKKRQQQGKVTFHYTERLYKKSMPWLTWPKHVLSKYLHFGRYKRTYLLSAGAFVARDYAFDLCFIGKSFKWGYITAVDPNVENVSIDSVDDKMKIMWCARFLKWKHPELPVLMSARLKALGYKFILDMFGSGEELKSIQKLIEDLGVEDCVKLCGNRPNAEILDEMRHHSIFLFTSDRYEGWGAVLNEAMSNGCVPIASDTIGSVPFLISDGENGLIFHSCNLASLGKTVKTLLDNPNKIPMMSKAAQRTMREVWSPRKAAENFLELAQHALDGTLNLYRKEEGPASWDKIR